MDQVLLRDEQLHEPVTVHDESVPSLSYRGAFRPGNGPVLVAQRRPVWDRALVS